jgi:hypothetical protein
MFHVLFWKLFRWPLTLEAPEAINAAITQIINVMLSYGSVVYGGYLVWEGTNGRIPPSALLFAGGGFWLFRSLLKLVLFPMESRFWVGLTIAFAAGVALHLWAAAVWGTGTV